MIVCMCLFVKVCVFVCVEGEAQRRHLIYKHTSKKSAVRIPLLNVSDLRKIAQDIWRRW